MSATEFGPAQQKAEKALSALNVALTVAGGIFPQAAAAKVVLDLVMAMEPSIAAGVKSLFSNPDTTLADWDRFFSAVKARDYDRGMEASRLRLISEGKLDA